MIACLLYCQYRFNMLACKPRRKAIVLRFTWILTSNLFASILQDRLDLTCLLNIAVESALTSGDYTEGNYTELQLLDESDDSSRPPSPPLAVAQAAPRQEHQLTTLPSDASKTRIAQARSVILHSCLRGHWALSNLSDCISEAAGWPLCSS